MERKKKIGLFIPSISKGGAERIVSELSLNLSKNFDVKVILVDEGQIEYNLGGEVINLGVRLPDEKIRMSRSHFSKISDRLKWNLFYIYNLFVLSKKLKKVKRKEKFDVVISFLIYADLINVISKHKERTIVSARSITSEKVQGKLGIIKKQIIKFFYKKADNIIAVSKMVKKDLIDNFNLDEKKIVTIYNPCDINTIKKQSNKKLEKEYQKIFKHPTIINVGRLSYQKGQWHLIRAFKKVREKIPNAQLVILGEGELKSYLKSLAEKLELEKDVHFLGFQKNPFKFMKNLDLFVFPSLYEGIGNVIIESMGCNTPVISSDCYAGPREILAPKTDITFQTKKPEYVEYGVLVPVCDGKKYSTKEKLTREENILADEIIKLLKDNKLMKKYSKKSLERAKDFDIKKIIKEWEGFIRDEKT